MNQKCGAGTPSIPFFSEVANQLQILILYISQKP